MKAPDWIVWLSGHFSPEQYLFWTRWQCLAWTLADLLIVFLLICLSNQARQVVGRNPHRYSYAVLALTALLVPFVIAAPSGGVLFLVDVMITVPHFLMLCYLLAANASVYAKFLAVLVNTRSGGAGTG